MTLAPLRNPEDLTPETLGNCRACYEVRDLYWEREKSRDPERIAEIDRKLVGYLLLLDEPIEYEGQTLRLLDSVGFSQLEVTRLRSRMELTDEMRIKLRIFCRNFTNNIIGT